MNMELNVTAIWLADEWKVVTKAIGDTQEKQQYLIWIKSLMSKRRF